mmetsp:Transcript_36227/g.82345  ORF Transcript_36227/g.82345 Transcript_36227/m.82345 type:complete len:333 (-) Transcript_36227:78-1076(-)
MVRASCVAVALAALTQATAIRLVPQGESKAEAGSLFRKTGEQEEQEYRKHIDSWDPESFMKIPPEYLGQRQRWMENYFLNVLTGKVAKTDETLSRCCAMYNATGLRPHEHWGNASKAQISWWTENTCNDRVGASVLAVGAPNCDTWRFMKLGFVANRFEHFDISQKKVGADYGPYMQSQLGCSEEDRAKINASIDREGNVERMKSLPECDFSKFSHSSSHNEDGREVRKKMTACLQAYFGGLSPSCPVCYTKLFGLMTNLGDYVTHEPCMDQCAHLDQCWGMEKCVRQAGNCTRCFERPFLAHDFCVGGPTRLQVGGPTVLRGVMDFWAHLR